MYIERQKKRALTNNQTHQGKFVHAPRRVGKLVKEFSSKHQEVFQKVLHLFKKVLSSISAIIFAGFEKYFAPYTRSQPKKEAFFIENTLYLQNSSENICRFKKKPYLCIAFETRDIGRLAQLVQSICLTSRGSAVRIRQRPQTSRSGAVVARWAHNPKVVRSNRASATQRRSNRFSFFITLSSELSPDFL